MKKTRSLNQMDGKAAHFDEKKKELKENKKILKLALLVNKSGKKEEINKNGENGNNILVENLNIRRSNPIFKTTGSLG